MKRKNYLSALFVTGLFVSLVLTSCSNLIEDLKEKEFVRINGRTIAVTSGLTPMSYVFLPGRIVVIHDFYMCSHEVTQKEYETYCTYTGDDFYGRGENYPAYYVSWYDALVYCNRRSIAEGLTPCYTISASTNPDDWGNVPTSSDATWNEAECNWSANGYRLPTEVEWEYAARNENRNSYAYAGSNIPGDVAWTLENSGSKTQNIKTKAPNGKGLYDMSGNVWEWCWDWYGNINSSTGFTGSPNGSSRVARGGSRKFNMDYCTVSKRSYNDGPFYRYLDLGFRVVRTAD